MDIRTLEPKQDIHSDCLLLPLFEEIIPADPRLPEPTQRALATACAAGDLTGSLGQLLTIYPSDPAGVLRVLAVGLGKSEELSPKRVRQAFGAASKQISGKAEQSAAILFPSELPMDAGEFTQCVIDGMTVAAFGQDVYRAERKLHPLVGITLVGDSVAAHETAAHEGQAVGDSVNLTRDLVNRMPAEITPMGFAKRAEEISTELDLSCRVFGQAELEAERMNSMLAVAKGSSAEPCMVVVEYKGGGADAPTLALVGKGVTFDSGGLSLKPNDGMKTMKCDMAGAATVLGAIAAAARLKLPINVTGYMGLAENMVGAAAFKLGDVLTARNGKTIEVLNTDAEGRLVLADVLSYAVDNGADKIIDLATLTGACVVALGEDVTGAFTNDQDWCDAVLAAAQQADEPIWQLPMFDLYDKLLDGDVSDIKNVGPRWGGAITAAKFLEHFVGDTPWVHLDIAGPSFGTSSQPHIDAGGTGCMVRTLVEVIRSFSRD